MASMVAKASSSSCPIQVLPMASIQEKGSRNKRKFRADPPLGDPSKIMSSAQNEFPGYEFSAEKFEAAPGHGQSSACDLCGVNQYHSDGLKLDLGLSSALGSSEVGPSQPRGKVESEESHDADWSDLTESQLEELVLSNLDAIFKGAIKKIVACGYTEEEATKAILRSGLYYGCKYTVSNIVDHTLALLRNGHDIEPSREHCFEDLQQLGRYVLAELVCVLQEVRPFFSTGDAMWCLLICDMNVSHACAMDGDPLSSFATDGASNGIASLSAQPQLKPEAKCSELNLPNPCSQSETSTNVTGVPKNTKPKNCAVLNGPVSDKEGSNSTVDDKSSNIAGSSQSQSQSTILEEKFIVSRKVHSVVNKREYILRQKSVHLEKSYRTYGSKASRAGKLSGLGGLILDKKLKSVSDSTSVNIKNASLRLSKAMGVDVPQDNRNLNLPSNPSSHVTFNSVSSSTSSSIPKTDISSALPPVSVLPVLPTVNTPPASSAADTELSLSLPAKSNSTSVPTSCSAEAPMSSYAGILYDKSLTQWVPRDKKDEMIMKLIPRARELQNQLQEWTEWANQKVMQAARRLGKDKAELKSLRQEKEEVERHKKEKQTLEESTMKKLTEMENALCKASGQVEIANSAVQRLEVENAALRQEMEAAKLRAVESAASCQEVSKREKKTLMKFQSWEKQRALLQEEFATERHKVLELLQDLEQARQIQEQYEARWRQEEKAKEELLIQASSLRKEIENIEASAKSKEGMIKLKAETNLQKYKDEIQKLEKEISQLRLKTDSSKIAALRRGIDGSYASRLADIKSNPAQKESRTPWISEVANDFHDHSETGGVKRERECVMCLSEEMAVVFLPCAHQVVCTTCNELHEKQGMKDCPSCRGPIQQRIPVRYARS
ncbi:PREDICTED: putative E3 ubiquitin-protein ligase RF298 [Populus euphratica]|uniref:E3 ubiquitin-protein ligase RF298 n=1 Tax=Populus euphratica TaxID=75702 RepID=A0AAJ6T7J2_POPEU|nr:PREDICTED: putative E3 ubiquitin-protein ligase RF298 [Populus euphratica]